MSVRKKLQKNLNDYMSLRFSKEPQSKLFQGTLDKTVSNYESFKELGSINGLSQSIRGRTSNASENSMITDITDAIPTDDFRIANGINRNDESCDNLQSTKIVNTSHVSECFSNSESEEDWEELRVTAISPQDSDGSPIPILQRFRDYWKDFKEFIRLLIDPVITLLSSGVYSNLLGAMTCLYFTVTGIQYWGTKYLIVSLNAPFLLVNVLFIICAATGPTSGVFFGGYFIDSFGGFKGSKQRILSLEICSIFGILAALFSIPITLVSNLYVAVLCMWLVLFFGGSTLPACSGIIVSIVPKRHRPTSSSLSLIIFNLFGYFLSLFSSGLLMQYLQQNNEYCNVVCSMTWGFRLILFWSFFSVMFLLNALKCSYRDGLRR